jgi:hypothetical protein
MDKRIEICHMMTHIQNQNLSIGFSSHLTRQRAPIANLASPTSKNIGSILFHHDCDINHLRTPDPVDDHDMIVTVNDNSNVRDPVMDVRRRPDLWSLTKEVLSNS